MRACALALSVLIVASGAQASDVSVYRPWTGFYVGGNIGTGKAKASADFDILGIPAITASENLNGAVYGGQIGYNAQWGKLVLGVETDLMATSQKATTSQQCPALACIVSLTQTSEDSIPWLGTARLRAGVALGRAFIYGTGGAGYGAFKSTQTLTTALASVTSTSQEQRLAFVAGGGVEFALTDRWSVRAEYLHLDAGRQTTTYSLAGVGLITQHSRMTEDIGRFGVNFRF